MAILIINRRNHSVTPYEEWLESAGQELVMLSDEQYVPSYSRVAHRYAHIEGFANFSHNGNVEHRAILLHERYQFTTIIAISESDLLRAGSLRDRLGIAGQTYESAMVFRNKAIMKQLLEEAGIPVAPFKEIATAIDVIAFITEYSYPVVVKKVDGTGSKNIAIIRDENDLKERLQQGFQGGWIVEAYIPGDIYHIDGIASGGEVLFSWPSLYINSCLAYMDAKPSGSYVLEADNPLVERLNAMTKHMLEALPSPEPVAFHAEVFHTADDALIVCEIASRVGGSKIGLTLKTAFQIDLMRTWVQLQCGVPVHWGAISQVPLTICGNILVHPGHGTFLAPPEAAQPDHLVEYEVVSPPNQSYDMGKNCNDCLASFVMVAEGESEISERLLHAVDWFTGNMKWERNDVKQFV